jgi:hypothetical protein
MSRRKNEMSLNIGLSRKDLEDLRVIEEWSRTKLSISLGSKQAVIQLAIELLSNIARRELGL